MARKSSNQVVVSEADAQAAAAEWKEDLLFALTTLSEFGVTFTMPAPGVFAVDNGTDAHGDPLDGLQVKLDYSNDWQELNKLLTLVSEARNLLEQRAEVQRVAALRKSAMSKLTSEELEVLGL